jgi:hypothetical protein
MNTACPPQRGNTLPELISADYHYDRQKYLITARFFVIVNDLSNPCQPCSRIDLRLQQFETFFFDRYLKFF